MEYTRTNLAIKVSCKCGGVVAGTMIYGNVEIEGDFTDTIATKHNEGGKIEFINTDQQPLVLSGCKCK